MGKMTIEVNFRAAMASADELDAIADDLERALNRGYSESMSQLAGDWTGANAEYFQTKSAKLTEQIQKSVKRIRSGADEVRRTARLIRGAEMAALAIAKGRTY